MKAGERLKRREHESSSVSPPFVLPFTAPLLHLKDSAPHKLPRGATVYLYEQLVRRRCYPSMRAACLSSINAKLL